MYFTNERKIFWNIKSCIEWPLMVMFALKIEYCRHAQTINTSGAYIRRKRERRVERKRDMYWLPSTLIPYSMPFNVHANIYNWIYAIWAMRWSASVSVCMYVYVCRFIPLSTANKYGFVSPIGRGHNYKRIARFIFTVMSSLNFFFLFLRLVLSSVFDTCVRCRFQCIQRHFKIRSFSISSV